MSAAPITTRAALGNDLERIFEIYNHEVLHQTSTFETSLATRIRIAAG